MRKELCSKDSAGTCVGCNILEIARKKIHTQGVQGNREAREQIAHGIQSKWCPENRTMMTSLLKPPKRSIW